MMRLKWLPVNQVFVFTFGQNIYRLYLPENLGPAPLFFKEIGEATRVAVMCGLKINHDMTVMEVLHGTSTENGGG